MVDRLRADGISNAAVLAAMAEVPRERFVAAELVNHAYADQSVRIGAGQTMSMPWIVALMTAALELSPHARVLEIGTGCGYAAAVLSRVCHHVTTVERHPALAEHARATLSALGYRNIEVLLADGQLGAPDRAPFDAVSVTAMAEDALPDALLRQLTAQGTLVCPVGTEGRGQLLRFQQGQSEVLSPAGFVPLLDGTAETS